MAKVTFCKGGSGGKMARLNIPRYLLELIGISEEERDVKLSFSDGKIIIEKEIKD